MTMTEEESHRLRDYLAEERLRDRIANSFRSASPARGVTISGVRRGNQPDPIAIAAYTAILESNTQQGRVIDYQLASVRNVMFEELFQNVENRVR
jgi:hypothetical protein